MVLPDVKAALEDTRHAFYSHHFQSKHKTFTFYFRQVKAQGTYLDAGSFIHCHYQYQNDTSLQQQCNSIIQKQKRYYQVLLFSTKPIGSYICTKCYYLVLSPWAHTFKHFKDSHSVSLQTSYKLVNKLLLLLAIKLII